MVRLSQVTLYPPWRSVARKWPSRVKEKAYKICKIAIIRKKLKDMYPSVFSGPANTEDKEGKSINMFGVELKDTAFFLLDSALFNYFLHIATKIGFAVALLYMPTPPPDVGADRAYRSIMLVWSLLAVISSFRELITQFTTWQVGCGL